MTDNHRAAWTVDEISELKRLSGTDASIDQIAALLGRTPDAVSRRLADERTFTKPISLKQW